MLTAVCITSRTLPPKEGRRPLHILQMLVETKSGRQVVDVFHDQPGQPNQTYSLLPDVYMGKLSLAVGAIVQPTAKS